MHGVLDRTVERVVRRLLVMLAGVSGSDARRCLVWAVSWAPGVWFLEEEVDGFGRLKVY